MITDFRFNTSDNLIVNETYTEQWTGRFSPEGDKIYKQSFVVPDTTGAGGSETIALGFTVGTHWNILGGNIISSTGDHYTIPSASASAVTGQVSVLLNAAKTDIVISYGSLFDSNGGSFLIEYTR